MNLSSCAQFSCVPPYGRRTPTLFWIAAAVAIAATRRCSAPGAGVHERCREAPDRSGELPARGFCVGCGAAQRRECQPGVQQAAPVSRAGWRGRRLGAGGCGAAAVGCCCGGCAGRRDGWRSRWPQSQLDAAVAPGRRPTQAQGAKARRPHGRGPARRPRLHELPQGAPPEVAFDQPARTPQRRDQATHQRRRPSSPTKTQSHGSSAQSFSGRTTSGPSQGDNVV